MINYRMPNDEGQKQKIKFIHMIHYMKFKVGHNYTLVFKDIIRCQK